MALQPILKESVGTAGEVLLSAVHRRGYYQAGGERFDQAHIHSCYEIYVNREGDVSFFHDQGLYDVSSGDVIFSKPGESHYCIYHSDCVHDHFCIWFDDGGRALSKYCDRIGIPPAVRLSKEGKERLFALLSQLTDRTADPLLKGAWLIELLTLLGSCAAPRPDDRRERPPVLANILEYIDTHYKEIRTTAELADACFLSQSTVNRLFRKYVGLTVLQVLNAKRLSHAESLLREGCSVTDACFASGFTDCSRFIALFKKTFGVTPLCYKQALYKK